MGPSAHGTPATSTATDIADDSADRLASVLSEFARTLLTDFSIQEILDHLVVRIVDALPVSAAGVSLITPGRPPRYVAASDEAALAYERLQTSLGDGPCLEAFETGAVVTSPDLLTEVRFPEFTRAALDLGLRAVFSAPMLHSSGSLGALDLSRDTPGPLSARDLVSVQTLADVATAYVLNAEAREEARTSADLFRESSLHDPLTGLPNRVLMMQRMAHAGVRARRSDSVAAVLFADLDNFKRVNDAHGHGTGDLLLIAVAQRLLPLVRAGDTLARLSGDEFLFLCEDLSATADVDKLVTRIHDAFGAPFVLPHVEVSITASVGVAFAGPGEQITPALIRDADSAMYVAKRSRKALDPEPAATRADDPYATGPGPRPWRASTTEDLSADLGIAMSDHALDVVYQPIVLLADGRIQGAEALLQWNHPVRGAVPASTTVAVAEHAGLIDDLGEWLLRRSCQDRAAWPRDESTGPLTLGINLSAVQLLNPGLVRTVQDALGDVGADPTTVVCQITENLLVQDGPRALVVLESLKELGLRIALDGFGTGYSSLTHLHRFPVDVVKIDRSFIGTLTGDDRAAAIVRAIVDLGHELGMSIVAAGAQTERQVARLRELGCDSAQGPFFAHPMSTTDLSDLVVDSPAATILPAR
jgi:diguanylate cyclase (GGDEF)-like protein